MNNEPEKKPDSIDLIKDNFNDAMMADELRPITKCLLKNCHNDLLELISKLQAENAELKERIEELGIDNKDWIKKYTKEVDIHFCSQDRIDRAVEYLNGSMSVETTELHTKRHIKETLSILTESKESKD